MGTLGLRSFLIWLVIIGVETVHGILRTLFLAPLMGDFPARRLSVFTGALLIFSVSYLSIHWLRAASTRQLLGLGCLWVALTLLFEIGLGRLVLNLPWARIAEDYDIRRGGLLGYGLLFMGLCPLVAARLRGVVGGSQNSEPS